MAAAKQQKLLLELYLPNQFPPPDTDDKTS
ncbi:hypothetical protein ABIB66_007525 [Bradyrhizobium sp. F1.13.3]